MDFRGFADRRNYAGGFHFMVFGSEHEISRYVPATLGLRLRTETDLRSSNDQHFADEPSRKSPRQRV